MIKYSVVVATYNRAELLKQCLEAIASQNIPKSEYELLLINDGSKDQTDEIVKQFSQSHSDLNFTYFKQKNSGPAKARNIGIKNAKGEIIFFTDDDCIVPPNWIEALTVEYMQKPELAGVGGWYKYDKNHYSKLAIAYIDYTESGFYGWYIKPRNNKFHDIKIQSGIFNKNPVGNTSNMSYRKCILEKIGGFDISLDFVGLIDWELKKRIMDGGHQLLYISRYVLHQKPLTLEKIMMKFFNRGRGIYNIVSKNPEQYKYYFPSLSPRKLVSHTKFIFDSLSELPDATSPKLIVLFIAMLSRLLTRTGWEYQSIISRRI